MMLKKQTAHVSGLKAEYKYIQQQRPVFFVIIKQSNASKDALILSRCDSLLLGCCMFTLFC